MDNFKKFLKRTKNYIPAVFLFAFMIVIFQFMFLHSGGNDDFLYSVPAKASFNDFLHFMNYHYDFCNSRTIIHFVFIFLLKFDVYLWRILMPICFCSIPLMASAFLSENKKEFDKIFPVMSIAFLSVNAAVYSDALFWAAGSMNYVFPATLIMALLLCIKKGRFVPLQIVLVFLCGASTEQYGIITVAMIFMIFIYRTFILKIRKTGLLVVELGLSIAGYLTILLSPAIDNRTYADNTPLFYKFQLLFFDLWFGNKGMLPFVVFIAICVCCAMIIYNKGILKKLSVLYCVMLFASIAVAQFNIPLLQTVCIWGYPVALIGGMVFVSLQSAAKKFFVPLGALLLGGGAQFMMMFTQRMSVRITMPSVFCFIIFCVSSLVFAYKNVQSVEKNEKNFSFRFVTVLTAIVVIFIAVFNSISYVNYCKESLAKCKAGESSKVVVSERQTREDVDKIIDMFETVRLDNIEKYSKISK